MKLKILICGCAALLLAGIAVGITPAEIAQDFKEVMRDVQYEDVHSYALEAQKIAGTLFLGIVALMIFFLNVDFRHPRKLKKRPNFTIIIPCYNDGASIEDTIESVFRCIPREGSDVIVINDGSKDNSLQIIEDVAKRYPIRIINNQPNKGKANSMNAALPQAKYDIVLSLDADTLLNQRALTDMLARMEAEPRLGAVSAPYRPGNKGILPLFQHIDYNMFSISQGASNCLSVLGLWGGCLMMRREAFYDVKGFSAIAIADDFDFAFRLNRARWRVSQTFFPVRTIVPETPKSWLRQKLRWTSGGMQCYVRYITTWLRNPIQVFFFVSYAFFLGATIPELFQNIGYEKRLIAAFCACLPGFFYVSPMIQRWQDVWKLLLSIPFSLIYLPIYMVVNFMGLLIGIRSLLFPKKSETQAWVN